MFSISIQYCDKFCSYVGAEFGGKNGNILLLNFSVNVTISLLISRSCFLTLAVKEFSVVCPATDATAVSTTAHHRTLKPSA